MGFKYGKGKKIGLRKVCKNIDALHNPPYTAAYQHNYGFSKFDFCGTFKFHKKQDAI